MEIPYLHKNSDPFAMRLEIEIRCILFPLIILEMFLQLDWSPPVVNSNDWTWFGKAHTHTCLYNVPQLIVHVRAKTKPWGFRNCTLSSETGLCRGTDLGKGTKNMPAALNVPKNTVASIILKWKKFGTTKTLPRAGRPGKTEGERGLGQGGDQEPDGHSDRAPKFCAEPSRRTTISAALDQCSAFMLEWPDRSYSSVKATWQPTWSLPKGT